MFSTRLTELRKNKNLTQQDVADHLKISRSTYAQYETGRREPDFNTLQTLADFFGVTTDYLLGQTDKTQVSPYAAPAVSPEDLALLEKLKNLSPEKRKAIEILAGDDEQAAGVGN